MPLISNAKKCKWYRACHQAEYCKNDRLCKQHKPIVMKETNPVKKNASLKIKQMKKQDCCQKKKKEASSEV